MSNGPTSAQLAAKLSLDTSGAIAEMQRAGAATDTQAKRMERALKFVNEIIRERQKLEQTAGVTAQQTVAQQTTAANSAKQTAWAMRLVPAQFTDVFTQLAGGANPMLVLIQQGGQLKDLFGGFGPMFQGLASYLTPAKLAFGAVALAVGTLGYEMYQQAQREKEFQKAILLTGNYAGVTATSINAMAAAKAAAGNMTQGEAKSSIIAVVGTGAFGPDNLDAASEATIRMQRITGDSADKVVKDFAAMQDGVAKWAAEHNKSMHFISAAQYEQIKAQEDAGNTASAMAIVLDALNKRLREQGDQVGLLSGLWTTAKSAMEDYAAGLSRMLNPNGTFDNALQTQIAKLASLRASLAKDEADIASGAGDTTSYRAQANATRQKIAEQDALVRKLLETYSVQQQVTRATADYQERQAQGIAGAQVADKFQREASGANKAADEIEKYRAAVQKMRDAGDPKAPSKAEEDRFVALYRKKHQDPGANEAENFLKSLARQTETAEKNRFEMLRLEAAQKGVSAAAEPYIKRLEEMERKQKAIAQAVRTANGAIDEQTKQYGLLSGLVESGNDLTNSYIQQTQEIGLTARELEKLQAMRKIELALQKALLGANEETARSAFQIAEKQRQNVNDALADKKKAEDAYKADPANGARKALKEYVESAKDAAKGAETLISGSLARAEDAFINFAKTGKLSLGDLFGYMAEEYLRQMFRMQAAKFAEAGGFNLSGMLTSAISWFGGMLPGHANGLAYVPYDGYTTRLHEGEKVLTKAQAMGQGGSGLTVDNSIGSLSVGAGVSRGEMMAALRSFGAQQEQRMRRAMYEGRTI